LFRNLISATSTTSRSQQCCDVLQRAVSHARCITLHHTAIRCNNSNNTLQYIATSRSPNHSYCSKGFNTLSRIVTHSRYITLQRTATYCYTLHHTAIHCNINNIKVSQLCLLPKMLQHIAAHCKTLQRIAASPTEKTLQHTATHCNTLPHTTRHCNVTNIKVSQLLLLPIC